MSNFIAAIVAFGYPLAALVVMLESLGAPLPGETLIIGLGAAAGAGGSALIPIFLALWVGSVVGDNIGYLIGRRFGIGAVAKVGHRFGLTDARLQKFEAQYRRYGAFVVVAARFFVILRQLNGILAGSFGLPWWRFLAANIIGAALWVGFWLFLSARLSTGALAVLGHFHHAKVAFILLAAITAAVSLAWWLVRARLPR